MLRDNFFKLPNGFKIIELAGKKMCGKMEQYNIQDVTI